MDYHYSEFVTILQVNELVFKFYENGGIVAIDPDSDNIEYEHNEDLLIERIELVDDELTDFIEYRLLDYYGKPKSVELDGYTQPVYLEKHLEEEFEKFRIALTKDSKGIKANELREMIQEIKYARNELELIHRVNRESNWMIFDSLLLTKKDFCIETIRFLRLIISDLPEEKADESSYYFNIKPECTPQRHNILNAIHKALKTKGYVDCTPNDFKEVFVSKNPKPIGWHKPLRHLTYLIKAMTGQFLVEKNKPSNYYIAEKCFNIYKKGILFPPKRLRHDDDPNPKDKAFIDHLLDDAISSYV